MRSLAFKLTLAFLLVGLIGVIVVAQLVRLRTQSEFNRLILNRNQEALIASLIKHYADYGSWEGIDEVFHPPIGLGILERDPYAPWEIRRTLFTITDAQGKVLFGGGTRRAGQILSSSDLRKGVAIRVEGEIVGWLIFNPDLDRWRPGTPEGNFLLNVNRAILVSALLATGIALVVGGVLAYTLTRSLRELTAATQEVASGKLGHQVPVRSKDELGVLAESFNRMSSELARSTALRRKMTADIAHDLRTPLSVILGYTEALQEQKLAPDAEMFSVMHKEARHLNHLIDDLKTLALADAGELPLNFQLLSPGELLQQAADAYRVYADQKGITLQTAIPPNLPFIWVDGDRMAQVLGNLMSNALRYTPAGGTIRLSADQVGDKLRLQVADNGIGIAPEDLPYIFERTFRGDKSRHGQEGETGLGLAIAKSLVEAQAGTISVESTPGHGTIFTILLPTSD